MSRGAFLCSFIQEIKERRAHGFFVRYDKNLTIDERRRVVANSRRGRARARRALPEDQRDDIDLILMKSNLQEALPYGKWDDLWVEHPNPMMNEPHKAMCWLTPDDSLDEDTVAGMHLMARLARVDNVFALTRRLFQALERPLGTRSAEHAVWSGYQPYNPAMIQKYLTIFRTVNNFIQVGVDDKTPAMRLGLAKRPLTYRNILWPKGKASSPRRAGRRGQARRRIARSSTQSGARAGHRAVQPGAIAFRQAPVGAEPTVPRRSPHRFPMRFRVLYPPRSCRQS